MQGYSIQFKVFANSQQEADSAGRAIALFVDSMAQQGIAVTASKLTAAVQNWGDNIMVKNYFKR